MPTTLKPFVITIGDIQFLLDQVNLVPLFDADGKLLFNWGGDTTIYATSQGAAGGAPLFVAGTLPPAEAVQTYGASYYSVADAGGVRDVSGLSNNLNPANADWGAADVPFLTAADISALGYGNYLVGSGADYGAQTGTQGGSNATLVSMNNGSYTVVAQNPNGSYTAGDSQNVVDYTPRMITQTIMTGGVRLLLDADNHIVHWNPSKYTSDAAYADLIDSKNIDISKLVEGAAIVNTYQDSLGTWDAGLYAYGKLMAAFGITSVGATVTIGGTSMFLDYVPAAEALMNVVDQHGIDTSTLNNGDALIDISDSPYGLLAAFGVQDQQNPNNGEFFIESQNPGVAPTNGFFAIFGQFFDHGLDFIAKGGAGQNLKVTIPLAQDDPLYGVIGQDGQPTYSITITRALIDSYENGVAQYINHTSPFIDQSQTYGSIDQMTDILREWVVDPNSGDFIAGARLLDGEQNVAWTDGFGNQTTATLPTLNELRAHVEATGRDSLTWEDVLNLRNRDDAGHISSGNSGHALLLDMNPHVDGAHLSSAAATAAVATLNDGLQAALGTGSSFAVLDGVVTLVIGTGMPGAGTYTGVAALAPWVNFADFSIQSSLFGMGPALSTSELGAISEILMDSVGDHYIAGDGRVNENVALTSMHHIFHMEHDYQAQNLEIALFQQDAANGVAGDHAILNDWQVAVATADANGTIGANALVEASNGHWVASGGILARDTHDNYYVVAAGTDPNSLTAGHSIVTGRDGAVIDASGSYTDTNGFVSWNQEKLFEGIKLIVEMEYQHTAVDQYARAITPDIPEFSAYSTELDATISMAYAQGAFRFGHSTLRETIDTMDPNGDMTGQIMSYALQKAFLNPALFNQVGASSIVMGMTRQVMNDIDEFVTPALQQGLLDLPMDLAAINIARGRDVGLPTLNQARGLLDLTVYTSWNDFAQNMTHAESLVNFIAAYSFDGNVALAQAVLDGADAGIAADVAFMNGADDGFQKIDLWIGGLAEAHISGGLLGETFNVVFVDQIQRLMDGDRFYYLYRLAGTQFGDEIINEQFKDMVERNTGTTHLNGNIFGYADKYYELGDEQIANQRLYDQEGGGALVGPEIVASHASSTVAATLVNPDFDTDSLASGAPGVVTDWRGNYSYAAPTGWAVSGTGGLFAPVDTISATAGHAGANVAWLSTNAVLAQDTGIVLAAGSNYTLNVNVGDRTDMAWPGGAARLVATNGVATVVLATASLTAPADGQWAVTTLDSGVIDGAYAGYQLRIEVQNGGGNQILVDDVSISVQTPGGTAPVPGVTYYDANGVEITNIPLDAEGYSTINLYTAKGDRANAPLVAVGGTFDPSVLYYDINGNPADQHKYGDIIADYAAANNGAVLGVYTHGGNSVAGNGQIVVINGISYVADIRPDLQPDVLNTDGGPTSGANSAEVVGGTKGKDLIYLGFGDDTGYGDDGDDIIYGGSGGDRIYGGAGNDTLYGDDLPDVVDGGEGDDLIYGGDSGASVGGFDQLIGGDGNDTIYGGIGIDKIFGNNGDDAIYGGADTDPFIFGGEGNDIVDGGDEQDNIYGGTGDDLLIGGADKDIMFGQAGDDILRPGVPTGSANPGGGNTGNAVFGPDEVVGGAGNVNEVDTGFDIIDLSDNTQAYTLEINLNAQNNPLVTIDQNQVLPTMIEMDGIVGTQDGDNILGNVGSNWLIGGSGNDVFETDVPARLGGLQEAVLADRSGNDVIIGGSARLDTLIGKYMTNGMQDAYETAYGLIGASHRVSATSVLTGGILNSSALMVNGVRQFESHFTEMLRSDQFKDLMLGDDSADGQNTSGNDTVVFTGNFDDYSVLALDVNGNVVTDLLNNFASVYAVRITDNGTPNADPLLAREPTDGTDLVIGVENFQFADGVQTLQSVVGVPPTLTLDFATDAGNYADNFNTASFSNSTGGTNWAAPWVETGDDGAALTGQIRIDGVGSNNVMEFGPGDGAAIERVLDLSAAATATISYTVSESGFGNGETVTVTFAPDGVNFQTVQVINSSSNNISSVQDLSLTGPFTDHAVLRFEVSNVVDTNTQNDYVRIDGLDVSYESAPTTMFSDISRNFTENGGNVTIIPRPVITDDGTTLTSARVVLTNAQNGDELVWSNGTNGGGFTASVDTSVAGIITATLTSATPRSFADFAARLDNIQFRNTSDNPGTDPRIIQSTVNDGRLDSAPATTTINVTAINDAPNAADENVITNIASGTSYLVPGWALLANDTDPEGNALTLTSVSENSQNFSATLAAGDVQVTDSSNNNRSFTYTVSDGSLTDTNNVSVTRDTNGNLDGNNSNTRDILIGSNTATTFNGGTGDDIIIGGSGNDTMLWYANAGGATDGHDFFDGGAGNDTVSITGRNGAESFNIYTTAAAILAGLTPANTNAEIVITRDGSIIAELDNVEEIVINALDVTANNNNGGLDAGVTQGDTVAVFGDFSATSLNYSTIHVNGSSGDDTVDISHLESDHRVVFETHGGNDSVVGTLRPQDMVIGNLATPPQETSEEDDEEETAAPPASPNWVANGGLVGTAGADVLTGTSAGETILGHGSADMIFAGGGQDNILAGDGDDMVFGDGGNDRIFGEGGDDYLNAGAGNDVVFGGAGADRFVAEAGDGDDTYYGDLVAAEAGNDTLDMSAILADVAVDLGSGLMNHGSAYSAATGHDQLWSIENVITGSGNDVITAGTSVNVMDGGDGNDVFRFTSVEAADGDVIASFQPGDKVDVSGIDANGSANGNQAFTIVSAGFSGPGQLMITEETRDSEVFTVITGNVEGNDDAEFSISIRGSHHLTATDFTL